ncbi:coiled-coil domain-containing protein 96 [Bufo bufo]|uniref:coiled-coil domain-containing protein 96 n=1 Tax=Bufo bufo TaxID=8384 RepID=UPI001ABDA56E|nr:coiled-coil domain-containing protein 96 [Bufo bufo]
MGDPSASGEMVAEGGERLPGTMQEADTEPAIIQEGNTELGSIQKGGRVEYALHEGASERPTSEEGARERPTSEEGAHREPNPSQEGAREPGASQEEGAREPGASQEEGAREPGASQEEGAREPGASQEEGAREPGASQEEGARELGASQEEGAREPGGSQEEGAREPGASQEEGAREPSASQEEGAREPSASQEEGAREPGTSQEEGAREPGGSQEDGAREPGAREPSASQEGAREPSASQDSSSQEDTTEPGTIQEDLHISTSQESTRDPTAGQIVGMEPSSVMEENGLDSSEPHHETEEHAAIPKDELELSEETDQEPKEETLLEEQEEGEEETEQDQELEADEEQIREELMHEYHALAQDRDKIQQHNSQLQHKLYEYFRKKKGEETRPETSKHMADQEQRYLKYLATLEEMRKKYKEEASFHQQQIEELKAQCQDIVSKVDKEWMAFQEQKKKIALCSLSKRGAGKHAASSLIQEIDLLQSREERKEKEVIQVRLENIKLKNLISRYESTLRSKEELAEGLHLIDFEQLKIENQNYNEKIEERNEELLKLKKKITNTVQVLTHVKEKLQFVQAENQKQKERLMEVEALVGNKRDILTKTKQARDSLRMDNLKLKQKCGLLGNKVLLRDFEDKVDAIEERSQTLENLKRRHAELTLSSKGLMKKINEAKMVMEG